MEKQSFARCAINDWWELWMYQLLSVPCWVSVLFCFSVWHCASVSLALHLGSWLLQVQACLSSGLGRGGHSQQTGELEGAVKVFFLPCPSGPSILVLAVFLLLRTQYSLGSGSWFLKPGVGKSFSMFLVSGYFITRFFLNHASTSLNSSYTEFSKETLSKSFLYCLF